MKSLLASLLFLLPLACKNSENGAFAASDKEVAVEAEASPREMSVIAPQALKQVIPQQIIREGNLRFETDDLQKTYAGIAASVKKYNAVIQNDAEGKDYESVFRNITVRIPAQHFDAFLTDVGKGVSYFDRKEISARDVTEEFIDADARLKTKKALEARYLSLLGKAGKISEIVAIEKELAVIREEIEAKEGQLKYLRDRVALSTVSIEFYRKVALESGVTASYGSKMWNAIKSGFNGISVFFIGLLHIWPFIIILVLGIFMIRRKLRKKTS
ncbi:MAG TPA: DUF4349 domain-containing protein [Flavobacterium sp.]|jgi:hypothetical protein